MSQIPAEEITDFDPPKAKFHNVGELTRRFARSPSTSVHFTKAKPTTQSVGEPSNSSTTPPQTSNGQLKRFSSKPTLSSSSSTIGDLPKVNSEMVYVHQQDPPLHLSGPLPQRTRTRAQIHPAASYRQVKDQKSGSKDGNFPI